MRSSTRSDKMFYPANVYWKRNKYGLNNYYQQILVMNLLKIF